MEEKIAVNVKTQEEYNILMDAYRKKWWCFELLDTTKDYWYVYWEETCISFRNKCDFSNIDTYKYCWYKIISIQEALQRLDGWTPEEIKAVSFINMTQPLWRSVSELLNEAYQKLYDKSLEKPFNHLQKKPMSKLRENIRNNFFNTQEKHLTNLVSNLEEKTDEITDVLEVLYDKCEETKEIIELLENAIDDNDKAEVNKLKKRLETIAVDFDDKLWEQLMVIAKKLNK